MRHFVIAMMWGWYTCILVFTFFVLVNHSFNIPSGALSMCLVGGMIGTIGGLLGAGLEHLVGPNWERWDQWKRRHNFGKD